MTWYNNSWNYRKAITISNSGSALSDYQILVTVDTASLVASGKMQSNCNDIRFTLSDDSTLLNYWIESDPNTSSTKIWVKIPSIANGSNTIYLYYGYSSATAASNGINTFVFFDDFSGDLSKWTIGYGGWVISSGEATGTGSIHNSMAIITDIPNMDLVFTYYVRGVTTYQAARLGGGSRGTIDPAYAYVHRNENDALQVWNGSAWSTVVYSGLPDWSTTSTPSKMELYRTVAGAFKSYKDNVLIGSGINTAYTTLTWIGFYSYGASQMYIDKTYVRKYAATEPTVTTFAEQVDTTYTYRKPITINNTSGNVLTNYQIPITINTSELIHAVPTSKMRSGCEDIRFTSDSSSYNEQNWSVSYPYWIESGIDSSSTKIWIKIDSITTGSSTIYMYYGNQYVTNISDGSVVAADFTKYTEVDPASKITVIASKVTVTGATTESSELYTTIDSTGDFTCNFEVDVTALTYNGSFLAVRLGDSIVNDIGGTTWGTYNEVGIALTNLQFILQTHVNGSRTMSTSFFGTVGTLYYCTFTRIGTTLTVKVYTDSARMTQVGSTLTLTVASTVWTQLSVASNWTNNNNNYSAYIQNLVFRKYTATEPTVTTSAEQTITAKSMSIIPRESPCRVGICIIDVSVTWTNTGESVTFTPSIIVDSTAHSLAPRALPAGDTPIAFEVSGLSVGNHTICPIPN